MIKIDLKRFFNDYLFFGWQLSKNGTLMPRIQDPDVKWKPMMKWKDAQKIIISKMEQYIAGL